MEYVSLGSTGMQVSKLCLGCMSYGEPGWRIHPWVLNEQDAQPFLKEALDAGINFFDTSNYYSFGASEEILGNFVKKNVARSEVVIATKVGLEMDGHTKFHGLSRKHIFEQVDASLKRLKTDYIDLFYIHRLDGVTPLDEVCDTLNDVVRSGKVLHLAASSMWTWQFVKMRDLQLANGWASFVAMQNFYNLAYREEEREMNPYCLEHDVALVPWSPMARGFLAGNRSQSGKTTERGGSDKMSANYFGSKTDYQILSRVEKVADRLGVKPAQVALAWVLARGCASPIIGATKAHHISDALGALDIRLDAKTLASLEQPYKPRAVAGHN